MPLTNESYEVNQLVSNIIADPSKSSQDLVKELFPDLSFSDQVEILSGFRDIVEKTLNTKLTSGLPNRIHNLRFCWRILRLADNALRLTKAGDFPRRITIEFLKELFRDVFPFSVEDTFIIERILEKLGVESNGAYAKHYSTFLKASSKPPLNMQICGQEGDLYINNLRRIIYWIIRRNRYKYVEESNEGRIIHFLALADDVLEELRKWCRESDLQLYGDLTEEIENQINSWLEYSCLDGDSLPSNPVDQAEIAKAFVKENTLNAKIRFQVVSEDPITSAKVIELESEISRYVEDIRRIESENAELKNQITGYSDKLKGGEIPSSHPSDSDLDRDFLEYLKIIDSKYSFDALRSIQLGEEKPISMKNFVSHFFFGLRKKGLVTYPSETEFALSYEQSGLYSCLDFEVPPGKVLNVSTQKQGWAIKRGGNLFPIRKAIVKLIK